MKVILVTKKQFKNYNNFIKISFTNPEIKLGMMDLGYQPEEYLLFKGYPIVTEVKDEKIILRDFRSLSEKDFGEWRNEIYKIPAKEQENIECLTGRVAIF